CLGATFSGRWPHLVRLHRFTGWAVVIHRGINEHQRQKSVILDASDVAVHPLPAIIKDVIGEIVHWLTFGEVVNVHGGLLPLVVVGLELDSLPCLYLLLYALF